MSHTRFIEITDYDGRTVHIDGARVVKISDADPQRVNHHGSVTLDTGEQISFRNDNGPTQLRQTLERWQEKG